MNQRVDAAARRISLSGVTVFVAVVALVVSAFALGRSGREAAPTSATDGGIVLLTHALGDRGEDAIGGGVLRFDAARGCVYLERRDGTRVLPQWPEGYHARSDAVRVYDAADTLVAEEGNVVTFSGGFHDLADLPPGTETCGVDTVDGLFIMGGPV